MIRVFAADDKSFDSNGDVVLKPLKAKVINNDNGDFFLELSCGTEYNDFLQANNIIVAPTPSGVQPFRISTIEKTKRKLEIKAWHVFYDAETLLIADSYAVKMTCNDALNHFNNATDTESPFTMYSDIDTLNSFRCVRKSLTECIATVIERWGGHIKRDGWNISVLKNAGYDHGVTIEYKKNLQELTATYEWENVVTKLMPVGKDGILLDERYVYAPISYEIPFTRALSFEQDIEQDDYPSEAAYIKAVKDDLKKQATEYVNTYCYPSVNYTLTANPDKVTDIGDIILVKDERIGVDVLTQVIAYEYDAILEKYTSLEFGNFQNTLSDLMSNISKETSNTVNMAISEVNTDTERIYNLLQNGYVIFRGDDVLVVDSLPASDAVNVLKVNQNGLSVSSEGISGLFTNIYDLVHKFIRINNENSINLYNNSDLIGSITKNGISLIDKEYLKVNDKYLQTELTPGDGIDITSDTISLKKYETGATILNASLTGVCKVSSGSVVFEIDIDRPCDGIEVYNLTMSINGNTLNIVTDGVTSYTIAASALTTLKYQISIDTISETDGLYLTEYNIQLKAL